MAISNRDRVGRAFEQLAVGLDPFIARAVADVVPDGHDWTRLLSAKDQQRGIPSRRHPPSRTDPQAQLRMLTENVTSAFKPGWYPFDRHLSRSQKSLASELVNTRNTWAHNGSFGTDDAYRALDTIERLLHAIDAPEPAEAVRRLRVDLRRVTSEQDDRPVTRAVTTSVDVAGLPPGREVLQSDRGVSNEFKQRLAGEVKALVEETTPASPTVSTEAAAAMRPSVQIEGGFLPRGVRVSGRRELADLLRRWLRASDAGTIGDVGSFGGAACIAVVLGDHRAVLNLDTKRAAVATYLDQVRRFGPDLPWRVIANNRGTFNKVVFGEDPADAVGWYFYLSPPLSQPGTL